VSVFINAIRTPEFCDVCAQLRVTHEGILDAWVIPLCPCTALFTSKTRYACHCVINTSPATHNPEVSPVRSVSLLFRPLVRPSKPFGTEGLVLCTRIREMLGSDLGRDTGFPDWGGFVVFLNFFR
jgi:hypothetical protein